MSRTPSPPAAAKVVFRCHELGALTIYTGIAGNVVELTPPLTISDDEVETAIRIVSAAIADVERGVVADEQLANYPGW
jgi:4-aminobutyrate aminotransferase